MQTRQIACPSGYFQQNPWLTIANKQLELMQKFMAELGLTPVARTRVHAVPPNQPKPWEFGLAPGERSKFEGLIGARDWS